MPQGKQQYFSSAGTPLVGGKVYTYAAGSTTPLATYTDAGGLTPNTNPVILDSRGEASIFFDGSAYKIVLQDSLGASIWTQDNLTSSSYTYLPAGTGAVATTVQAKLRESVSVKDFGAKGDGTTDDTAAIQLAINYAQLGNVSVFFPPGTYKVTASLNVTAAVTFVGASIGAVNITWTSTSLTVFNVNTNSSLEWRHLTFTGPASPVSGSVIALTGAIGNAFSLISDCNFVNSYNTIYCTAAYAVRTINCYFYNFINYGVHIQNTYNVDAGDSSILNCIFSGPTGGSNVCVYQESSGGLRLIDNKFNTGGYNYKLSLTTAAVTSDLVIAGNSFENATTANIQLTANVSGNFGNIVITGNQFAIAPINLLINPAYSAFSRATVTGNTFAVAPSGTACISVDYVSFINIDGNSLFGAATATGILAGSNSSGNIGVNTFSTGTWSAKITDSSGSMVVLPNRVYTASQAVTCSTGFGSLFSASGTVTFPITFASTPFVTTTPNTISGGVNVVVYSVSTTGFSYTALSVTNGGAGSFNYAASGVY